MAQDELAAHVARANPDAFRSFNPKKTNTELKYFKKAFALFDTDEDGVISASDVETGLRRLGQVPPKEAIEAMIRQVDVDGSGEIKFNDLLKISELAQQGELPSSWSNVDDAWAKSVNGNPPSTADLGRDLSASRHYSMIREKAAHLRKDLQRRGGLRILH